MEDHKQLIFGVRFELQRSYVSWWLLWAYVFVFFSTWAGKNKKQKWQGCPSMLC